MNVKQKFFMSLAVNVLVVAFGGTLGYLCAGGYLKNIIQQGTLQFLTGVGSLIGAGVIVANSWFVIRSIIAPLEETIKTFAEGTNQVSSASSQVDSASQNLAEGSSRAAAAIEQISSSLEEISSMTKKTLENSAALVESAHKTMAAMKMSHKSLKETDACMKKIGEAGTDASKIIKTSDEIAFQINLLALNAAVEAARAGEAGAGFAVVAEEVRNLAMRSAEAARKTEQIIGEMTREIKEGINLVTKTLQEFYEMGEEGKKTTTLIKEIDQATQEQAQGIEQINRAVAEIDKVTQQTAANAEEAASAAKGLSSQASLMLTNIEHLTQILGFKNGNGLCESVPKQFVYRGARDAGPSMVFPEERKVFLRNTGVGNDTRRSRLAEHRIVHPEQIIPLEEREKDF